jgi:kynurenine formamidase
MRGDPIDLTLPVRDGMKLFPGLPTFESESSVTETTGALTRRFTSSSHQGTHVDAPAHYVDDGATLGDLPLDVWHGEAVVVDLRRYRGESITAEVLDDHAGHVGDDDRVVLLTGDVDEQFGDEAFFDRASVLTPGAADWLVERGVALVANDFLTEGLDDPDRPVHRTILGAGVPIVEYLCHADAVADLARIELTCLPLHLPAFEASPVRAIAHRTA